MQDFFQVKVFAPRLKLRLLSFSSCIQYSFKAPELLLTFSGAILSIWLVATQYFRISSSFSLLILAKRSELKFFATLIPLVDHFNFNRITQNPLKKVCASFIEAQEVPTVDICRSVESVKGSGNSTFLEKDQLFYLKRTEKITICIYFSQNKMQNCYLFC